MSNIVIIGFLMCLLILTSIFAFINRYKDKCDNNLNMNCEKMRIRKSKIPILLTLFISIFFTFSSQVNALPDGEEIPVGSLYTFETNNISKDDEILETYTFKTHNGEDDIYAYKVKQFTPNGWLVGDVHYNDGETITVPESFSYVPDYVETITIDGQLYVPEKEDYIFSGWYDAEVGGNQIMSDEQLIDGGIYHAQYHPEYITITYPQYDDEETIDYGYEWDFSEYMDDPTWYFDGPTVTLHFNDDNNTVQNAIVDIKGTLTGIKINGVTYGLDTVYTFTEDSVVEFIVEDQTIDPFELPVDSLPSKNHYNFVGWYLTENFQDEPITSYNGTTDIDVYAKWQGEELSVLVVNQDGGTDAIVVHYGDKFTIPGKLDTIHYHSSDVTFKFNDGVTPDNVQEINVTFIPDGEWTVYNPTDYTETPHNVGDVITVTSNLLITPLGEETYSEVIIPNVPEREHYIFVNWTNQYGYVVDDEYDFTVYGDQEITANWRGEDITIHTPSGDITREYGTTYNLSYNSSSKANTNDAVVTFKYHNDTTDDTTSFVQKGYNSNGWLVNGVHYDNYSDIEVTTETTIEYDYTYYAIPVTFPSNPTKFRMDFTGWYDSEENGTKYTSYDELQDITLHAQWTKHIPNITTPTGIEHPDENDQYTFGTNNIPKDSEISGNVTFKQLNGEEDVVRDIIKSYTPNGWLYNGNHYDNGAVETILDDTTITPDYTESYNQIVFPDAPTKHNYTFIGWYTALHGGDKITSYDKTVSTTIYAHYVETNPTAEEYILPSNQPDKPSDVLATVTFKYHNGDPDTYDYVTRKYIINGWLVDGVYYHNGDIIMKTDDTVIEPNYTEIITYIMYPETPTNGDSRFIGWYTNETGGEQVFTYNGQEDLILHARYTDSYTMLKTGVEVANILKNRYNGFLHATPQEYQNALNNNKAMTNIALDNMEPVYTWRATDDLGKESTFYYSNADVIYMNPDSSEMFSGMHLRFNRIDLTGFNSSYVTNMEYMFYSTSSLTSLDLSTLDTSNVTNMHYFAGSLSQSISSLDFSNLNTCRVENFESFLWGSKGLTSIDASKLCTRSAQGMHGMFASLTVSEIDVSSFDTSTATDIGAMFMYDANLTSLDLSNFDTRNVTKMSGLVLGATKLKSVNLSSFDTSKVDNFNSMFQRCNSLEEIDISSFSTAAKPMYTSDMFAELPNLKTIYVSDKWNPDDLKQPTAFTFRDVPNLVGQKGTRYELKYRPATYARIDNAPDNPGLFTNKYPETYIITSPDDTTEKVKDGEEYTIPTNTYTKNDEAVAIITFDPTNGESSFVRTVYKRFIPNGFIIDDTVYHSGDIIRVTGDITLIPNYDEEIILPEFPSDPQMEHSTFEGWYTETENGDKVESFEGIITDTTLYGQWSIGMIKIIGPNGTDKVPYGSLYTFGTNDIAKADEILETYTFKPHNGEDDYHMYKVKQFTPNGWTDGTNSYQDGETITVIEPITYEPAYIEEIIYDGLDSIPTKTDYVFIGWFDAEESGNEVLSIEELDENVIYHAQYHPEYVNVTITNFNITDRVEYGYELDLSYYTGPDAYEIVDIAKITLHYNDDDDYVEEDSIISRQTYKSAIINDVKYELDDTYTFTEDTVITFVMEDHILPYELPDDSEKNHYTFAGWYTTEDFQGDPITSYSGSQDVEVYAKWIGDVVLVSVYRETYIPEEIIMHYGDIYTFEDLDDSYTIEAGDVTFDFNDGVTPNNVQTQTATITNPLWITYIPSDQSEEEYQPGEEVIVTEDIEVYMDGDYTPGEIIIPNAPTREHYGFIGWFDEWDNIIEPNNILAPITYIAKWKGEDITIHTPQGDETVEYGSTYKLNVNNIPKANTNEAEVTFVYHNDEDDDTTSYVQRTYTPNGWLVNNVHYDNNTSFEITGEVTIEPDYTSNIVPAIFPNDPTKFRMDFTGWYDSEEDGTKYTSYSKLQDITLHAQWTKHIPNVTTPTGIEHPDENDQYTFGTNNISKDSEISGNVTFKQLNGEEDVVRDIIKSYTPNGWLLNGVHYDNGETITILDDCEIIPDYNYSVGSIIFPNDPTKHGYTFTGWYTGLHGGDKVISYNKPESAILYAHYVKTDPNAEEYILPSNQPDKPSDILATVTFKYHNGDPDTYAYVERKYIINGWLVDGVYHHNGDIIFKTDETVIEPNYNEVLLGAQYPTSPVNGDSRFTGWYTELEGGERLYTYKELHDITLHAHYTDSYTMLKRGADINGSNNNLNGIYDFAKGVGKLTRANREQYEAANRNITTNIAMEGMEPVYVWISDDRLNTYYYSDADVIYLNPDSSNLFFRTTYTEISFDGLESCYVTNAAGMFYNSGSYLTTIDLSNLDTSNVTNARIMFNGLSKNVTTLDISTLNTANIQNFENMFSSIPSLESLDLSNFDTRSGTSFGYMFSNLPLETIDVSSFDTSNATSLSGMFRQMSNLKSIDLSNFDTRNVTSIDYMFDQDTSLESVNLSSFDTSNVNYSYYMFNKATSLEELDLSSFSLDNVTSTTHMFSDATNLKTIYVSDKWDQSKLSNATTTAMFHNVKSIEGQMGTKYSDSYTRHQYARVDILPDTPGYLTDKYRDTYIITSPDETTEEVKEYDLYTIPTNIYSKDDELLATVTFNPDNGEESIIGYVYKTYIPNGFIIDDIVYHSGDTIRVTGDITLVPNYDEEIVGVEFPSDPEKEHSSFDGWYNEDTKYTSYNEPVDIALTARWMQTGPTDIEVDSDEIIIIKDETKQIVVTTIPEGLIVPLTYSEYSDIIMVDESGLITAIEAGETTIKVFVTNNESIYKVINVTVINNKITSKTLTVDTRDLTGEDLRIIIDSEPKTLISEFLTNIDNDLEYIEVYDKNNELVDESLYEETYITTGSKLKLVINGIEYDNVIVIIRGDINEDGKVNAQDEFILQNHILESEIIEDYRIYAANLNDDTKINAQDDYILAEYILENISSLNS